MNRKSRRYLYHHDYIWLLIGLGIGAFSYFLLSSFPYFQAGVVVAMGLFYILWGTLHHAKQGDFHPKIVLEYSLIALIAIMMLLTQIFRK